MHLSTLVRVLHIGSFSEEQEGEVHAGRHLGTLGIPERLWCGDGKGERD